MNAVSMVMTLQLWTKFVRKVLFCTYSRKKLSHKGKRRLHLCSEDGGKALCPPLTNCLWEWWIDNYWVSVTFLCGCLCHPCGFTFPTTRITDYTLPRALFAMYMYTILNYSYNTISISTFMLQWTTFESLTHFYKLWWHSTNNQSAYLTYVNNNTHYKKKMQQTRWAVSC